MLRTGADQELPDAAFDLDPDAPSLRPAKGIITLHATVPAHHNRLRVLVNLRQYMVAFEAAYRCKVQHHGPLVHAMLSPVAANQDRGTWFLDPDHQHMQMYQRLNMVRALYLG